MSAPTRELTSALFGLDPATYAPHALHAPERTYVETNCYLDILIELMHARGDEPLAALGSSMRMDFEGDQWTFLKPAPEDVELLFGIDVHEMQPYRPLPEQIAATLASGRTLIVELDSFYLPDTAATSYRSEHVKSSVIAEAIDVAGERLRYFHATSVYELSDVDYRGVFRIGEFSADVLPPYTELVRFDAGSRLRGEALREASKECLRRHLAHRPASNPFMRFSAQLQQELPRLLDGDAEDYHAYAFATVRMAGSGFEVAAAHVEWLLGADGEESAQAFAEVVAGCKALGFRLARRRPFEPEEHLTPLAKSWERAMECVDAALA